MKDRNVKTAIAILLAFLILTLGILAYGLIIKNKYDHEHIHSYEHLERRA